MTTTNAEPIRREVPAFPPLIHDQMLEAPS